MGLIPQSAEKFRKALEDYAREMGLGMDEAGVVGAGELCKAALNLTPPMVEAGGQGLSKGAKDAGYNAVSRDVKQLFVAKDDRKAGAVGVALNKLKGAIKANDRGKFERIRQQATLQKSNLINSVTLKIVHDSNPARAYAKARNFFNISNPFTNIDPREVVTDIRKIHLANRYISGQGRMRVSKGKGTYLGKYVVESKTALDAYINETQMHVGFIKSGWWQVLSMLPKVGGKNVYKGSDVPVWIKRHAGTGYSTLMRNQMGIYIRIGNSVGDNDNQASKNNVHGVAMAEAMAHLFARIEQKQNREGNNFNSNS